MTIYKNIFRIKVKLENYKNGTDHPEVAAVLPNKPKDLYTTHSWEFMHLEKNGVVPPSSPWRMAKFGKDVIIANLDTGKSFFFFLFLSLFYYFFSIVSILMFEIFLK